MRAHSVLSVFIPIQGSTEGVPKHFSPHKIKQKIQFIHFFNPGL